MKISADSYFKNGTLHPICEDYTLHGTSPFPYAVLCDGCSSADNSEFGARLIAFQACKFLFDWSVPFYQPIPLDVATNIAHGAYSIATQNLLDDTCLDATLLMAHARTKDQIDIMAFGDGNIVTQVDDQITWTNIQYKSNAPYYISYLLDPNRAEAYTKKFNQAKNVTRHYFLKEDPFEPGIVTKSDHHYLEPVHIPLQRGKHTTAVYLMSDGVESFSFQDTADKISAWPIIETMLDFKNYRGEFIKRRMNKTVKKWQKGSVTHFDDLSISGFYIKEDSDESL
jgi:hypothetical protein